MNINYLWDKYFGSLFGVYNNEVKQKISDFKDAVEFEHERECKSLRDQIRTLDQCYDILKDQHEGLKSSRELTELKETLAALKSSLDHERNLVMSREVTIAELNRQLEYITARMNNYKEGYERLKREYRPLTKELCRIQDFQLAAEVYEKENVDHQWIKLNPKVRDIKTSVARQHLDAMKPYLKGS